MRHRYTHAQGQVQSVEATESRMKQLAVLIFCVAVASALPVEDANNGVEFVPYEEIGLEHIPNEEVGLEHIPNEEQGFESNWQLVPDGDGHLHLVNTDPFNLGSQDEPAPLFNADADTIFLLFTRNNRNAGHRIMPGNAGTLGPHWNGGRQTRFIIHGWNNNGGSEVNVLLRNAYLDRADINVITVDWGAGAQNPNYVTSRNHITAVGATVARFIDFLNQSGGMAFNNVYVSGHSLGGHTAGIVGKRVTRGRLNSVIALDPALPLFSINDPANRVASGDANYVEVIHTNGGLLGFDLPLGQADFYPNGGRSQPGCGVDIAGTCAHSRAWQFFGESIRTAQSGFNSVRCGNYDQILNNNCVSSGANARMGGEPSNIGRGVNGVYHLITNAQSPFARG
ncbi:phospholipase A1-like [Anopheles aquasalis]|uniref:phospholipase A1-like n=1 Tax=Anopheles aquasalis TaxID=42839 RepID=UPI00215B040A|nr:phospholipase A1-like [Anopheles aquasalis]